MSSLLILANSLMILVFIFKFNRLPPQIPLFYSLPLGESQLVDTWLIFLLPIIMNIFYFINNYFYKKFFLFSENNLYKNIFKITNYFLIIGFTLIFIKIIFLIS